MEVTSHAACQSQTTGGVFQYLKILASDWSICNFWTKFAESGGKSWPYICIAQSAKSVQSQFYGLYSCSQFKGMAYRLKRCNPPAPISIEVVEEPNFPQNKRVLYAVCTVLGSSTMPSNCCLRSPSQTGVMMSDFRVLIFLVSTNLTILHNCHEIAACETAIFATRNVIKMSPRATFRLSNNYISKLSDTPLQVQHVPLYQSPDG